MERNDPATAAGERDAAIAEDLTKDAVSRLIVAELDPPGDWPKELSWGHCNFGVLIETEYGSHTVAQDARIRPGDVIQRLIHPGFGSWHRDGGGVHWC